MLTGDILGKLCSCEDWEIIKELSLMNVSAEVLYRPFCTLSGGERTKALLAVMFAGENRFPLIDEPTNNLDENSRKTIEEYLRRKSGFILISHDRALLDGCIDHVLSINRKDIVLMKGNYSDWQREKDNTDKAELEENIRLKKEIKRLNESAKRAAEWADIFGNFQYRMKKLRKQVPQLFALHDHSVSIRVSGSRFFSSFISPSPI